MFDQTDDLVAKRDDQMLGESSDNLFERLVTRAEADLRVAQALAARESQRADQIKRLETTLIGHINRLQQQILESREAELKNLRSEISVCAERITGFEGTHSTAAVRKEMAEELGDLRVRLTERQSQLENRHSGFVQLGESLNAHVRALEDELHDELDGIRTAQAEMGQFKLATQSLSERVAHAESSSSRGRALASYNIQQLEQTSKSLRSEMSALNALIIELNDKQAERRLPDTLLQEVTHNFGAKIEEFEHWLQQEQHIQLGRDSRLGELDAGLALLAERVTKTESLAHESHAAALAQLNSAAELRQSTGRELAALEAKLNDLSYPTAVDKLAESLGARAEEWQSQAEQKFLLLDSRDLERERNARELAANLAAKQLEQEARTDEKLQALTRNHEELAALRAEIEPLAERIAVSESAAQSVRAQTDSAATQTEQLEDRLKSALAALSTEVAQLTEQQQALSLAQVERRENGTKLAIDLLEIQRQMARERDAFQHWGKGLSESLGAELSSTGAQLGERQSALEDRYAGLERSQETFKANLDALASQLKEQPAPEPEDRELWDKIRSELAALGERMSGLESRVREADDRANLMSRDTEHQVGALRGDLSALATSFDQRPPPYESIIHGMADKLGARLQELEDQLTRQFSLYEKRDGERDQRTEQMIATFKSEITALSGKLMQQPSAIAPDDAALSAVAESLSAKIEELRRQTAEKFNALASRAAEAQALTERSEPARERLAHLSAAPESSGEIAIFSGQPGAAPADLSTRPVAAAKGAGDSAADVHGQSEKEQLIKLEERMSSEIERVRAELKARSGRWKVRQSATLKRSGRFSLDPEL